MNTFFRYMACMGLLVLITALSVQAIAQEDPQREHVTIDPAVRSMLDELKRIYSTEIIMGRPMDVEGRKIIPLATAGFVFGYQEDSAAKMPMHDGKGAGGIMIPVGVLVISEDGDIQLLQLSKSFLEQLGSALAPFLVQMIQQQQAKAAGKEAEIEPTARPGGNVAVQFSRFRDLLASVRILIVALFLLGWLALIVVIDLFLPDQVTDLATTLQQRFWSVVLTGIVSFVVVVLLAAVLTISLIGLPLTFVVI